MKFMGSKRSLLQNGLGILLNAEASTTSRFFDLFSGSGAVACYVAQQQAIPVFASDLQEFSAALTGAVIGRTTALDDDLTWKRWVRQAEKLTANKQVPHYDSLTRDSVREAREWCSNQDHLPITRAYGGHYFSPWQTVAIDALRSTLPETELQRTVTLAALIQAASQCAAAPGHTAQPFQPTQTAMKFLNEAWGKNVVERTRKTLTFLAGQSALRKGRARVQEANEAAEQVQSGDLVFIDPPYSGVHYSRFYHVLETIAHGECGEVSGVGRYPNSALRPISKYSIPSESTAALEGLLKNLSSKGANVVVTFPDHDCSNGLSGNSVRGIARKHFYLAEQVISSRFSTLGGNSRPLSDGNTRGARQVARELILVLKAK